MRHNLVQITPHAMHSAPLYGVWDLTHPPRGGVNVFTYPSTYLWRAQLYLYICIKLLYMTVLALQKQATNGALL